MLTPGKENEKTDMNAWERDPKYCCQELCNCGMMQFSKLRILSFKRHFCKEESYELNVITLNKSPKNECSVNVNVTRI